LQAIYVSEYRRTTETAAPTAAAFGLMPTVVPIQGDKAAQAAATAAAINSMAAGSAALVVGHSNTVALLIAALGGPELPELCDMEYATIFVLELPADLPRRLLQASYGVADAAEAVACHEGGKEEP
jgi:phosphohistidine phosphatase SixA